MIDEIIRTMQDYKNIKIQEELADGELDVVVNPDSLVQRVLDRRKSLREGIRLPWADFQKDTCDFKLHKGTLNMVGGYTGHGKSTLTSQMALYAMRQGHKVGIASLEMFPEDVLEQFCEMAQLQAHPKRDYLEAFSSWARGKLFLYDRIDSIKPEEAIQMSIAFAKFCGCNLIVIDALMMIQGVSGDNVIEQEFSQTLSQVAKKFEVAILLVHHVRKPSSFDGESKVPGKYEFLGSSHLANIAASIMVVWHDKLQAEKRAKYEVTMRRGGYVDTEDYDPLDPDMVFKVVKNRYGRYEGAVQLWQHTNCRAFCSDESRMLKPLSFGDMGAEIRGVI